MVAKFFGRKVIYGGLENLIGLIKRTSVVKVDVLLDIECIYVMLKKFNIKRDYANKCL